MATTMIPATVSQLTNRIFIRAPHATVPGNTVIVFINMSLMIKKSRRLLVVQIVGFPFMNNFRRASIFLQMGENLKRAGGSTPARPLNLAQVYGAGSPELRPMQSHAAAPL